MKTTTIAFSAFKGGAGKTTSAVATAAELARKGYRVLIIDMDPQSDVATALGVDVTDEMITTEQAIASSCPVWPSYPTELSSLCYTPSSFLLENIQETILYLATNDVTQRLRYRLEFAKGFDFFIIDCPPRLDKLTRAAMLASDYVVVPAYPGPMHLKSITTTIDFIKAISQSRPKLKIAGILFANASHFAVNRETIESVKEVYPELVFKTVIRSTVMMAEAPLRGMARAPLVRNIAAADYAEFTVELLNRIDHVL